MFRARRQELDLTQEEAAARFGVRQQTIHRWEAGDGEPQRRMWPALQEFLNLDREQLLDLIHPDRAAAIIALRPGMVASGEDRRIEALRQRLVDATVARYETGGEVDNALLLSVARFVGLLDA